MENKNDGIQSSTGGKTKSLPNPPIILKRIKKKIKIKTWCWWDLEDKVHATLLNQFLLRFNPRRTRYPFEYFFRRSLCCFKVVSFDCICTVYTASSDSDELIGYTRSDKPPFFPNIKKVKRKTKTCALVFSLASTMSILSKNSIGSSSTGNGGAPFFHEIKKQASFFLREKIRSARLVLTDVTPIQL